MNQIHNQDRDPRGRRYIDEVKKFVLTLNFYSPRAHEYIRGVFSLPHTNSLTEWTLLIDCEKRSFMDIFRSLKARIDRNPPHKKNALCCAMP